MRRSLLGWLTGVLVSVFHSAYGTDSVNGRLPTSGSAQVSEAELKQGSETLPTEEPESPEEEKPLNELRLKMSGWIQTSFTGDLLASPNALDLRVFDSRRPEHLRLNQLKLTLERSVDTTTAFDVGGRVDFLYGSDSQLIHSKGLLDNESGEIQPDIEQAYVELWLGKPASPQGLNITLGKWVTTHGAEVIDAPANALFSTVIYSGLQFHLLTPARSSTIRSRKTSRRTSLLSGGGMSLKTIMMRFHGCGGFPSLARQKSRKSLARSSS